jgi:integrase
MICGKCKKEISDDSIFCNRCGKKLKTTTRTSKDRKRGNGQGTVYKLSGNRSRPWVAAKNKIILGYYATKKEAVSCVNANADKLLSYKLNYTLEQAYKEWSSNHYPTISKSQQDVLCAAWLYYKPLYKLKIKDIKTEQYQQAIDKAVSEKKSRSTCEKIRQLCSALCKFAMQYDIVNKNYSTFLILPKQEKKEKEIFTDEQIKLLFENAENETVKAILILIYTGLRIDELLQLKKSDIDIEKRLFVGGIKTDAGTNRTVPINKKIVEFIEYFYKKNDSEFLICNKVGNKKDVSHFRSREFYPTLKLLKIENLTPHATRRTFASLAVKAGIRPEVLKDIIGHADFSTTADFYIFPNTDEYLNEIDKM